MTDFYSPDDEEFEKDERYRNNLKFGLEMLTYCIEYARWAGEMLDQVNLLSDQELETLSYEIDEIFRYEQEHVNDIEIPCSK